MTGGRPESVRSARCAPTSTRADETILFWHRGLSITDIALGRTLLEKALDVGIGVRLPYRD